MKLTLHFKELEKEKPTVGDTLIILMPKSWDIIDRWNGEFLPADCTHWAKVDMSNLE